MAAMSIAAEYSTGDALSKATLDDVSQAFAPTDAKAETLSSLMEKAQKGEATKVGGEDVQLPESVTNYDDSVPPADLTEDSNERRRRRPRREHDRGGRGQPVLRPGRQ